MKPIHHLLILLLGYSCQPKQENTTFQSTIITEPKEIEHTETRKVSSIDSTPSFANIPCQTVQYIVEEIERLHWTADPERIQKKACILS